MNLSQIKKLTTSRLSLLLSVCTLLFLFLETSKAVEHTLVVNNRANTTIVTAANPSPSAYLAALELQHALKQISGVEVPIVDDTQNVSGMKILIGHSKFTEKYNVDTSKYRQDENLIQFEKEAILLIGKDISKEETVIGRVGDVTIARSVDYSRALGGEKSKEKVIIPGDFEYSGSLRATYRFLHKWLNVSYFGPLPENVHFPKLSTIRVQGDKHYHKSVLETKTGSVGYNKRNIAYGGETRASADQIQLFARRNNYGGIPWHINHSFENLKYASRFINPDSSTHIPEMIGTRANGKKSRQYCFTEEKFLKVFSKDAEDYFNNDEKLKATLGNNTVVELMRSKSDVFAVVPHDVGDYCECETCATKYPYDNTKEGDFNSGAYSDRVFGLVNEMARRVQKTNPGKFIGTLAYEEYFWPPSFPLEKNVGVAPCVHFKEWHIPSIYNNEFNKYKEWVKMYKEGKLGRLYLWTYDFIISNFTDMHYAKRRGQYVEMVIGDGVKAIFHCGGPDMVGQYVSSQLYEYNDKKTAELYNEFFERYFGPAAKEMETFYSFLEEITTNLKGMPLAGMNYVLHISDQTGIYIYNAENVAKMRKLIDAAKAKASGVHLKRIKNWEMDYVIRREEALGTYVKYRIPQKSTKPYVSKFLAGVTCYVDRYWQFNRGGDSLIDPRKMQEEGQDEIGSMNARLKHNTPYWNSTSLGVQADRALVFDLGSLTALESIALWNYNDTKDNRDWGMRNVEILYTTSLGDLTADKWKSLKKFVLPKSQQAIRPEKGEKLKFGPEAHLQFEKLKARYVMIRPLGSYGSSNWADPTKAKEVTRRDYKIGLGHVRFYGKRLGYDKPEIFVKKGKLNITPTKLNGSYQIRYTTDGSPVTRQSKLYKAPFQLRFNKQRDSVLLRTKVFSRRRGTYSGSEALKRFTYNGYRSEFEVAYRKRPIAVAVDDPDQKRIASAEKSINRATDGKLAGSGVVDGGYDKNAFLIDLGKELPLTELWLQYPGNRRILIQLSSDKKSWTDVVNIEKPKKCDQGGDTYEFNSRSARYIRIQKVKTIIEFKAFRDPRSTK